MPEMAEISVRFKLMNHVYNFLQKFEVLLRVPPLFVIDEILMNFGAPPTSAQSVLEESEKSLVDYHAILLSSLKLVSGTLGCIIAVYVFVLQTKNLVKLYRLLMSLFIIFALYWANMTYVESVLFLGNELEERESSDSSRLPVIGLLKKFSGDNAMYYYPMLQGILTALFCTLYEGPKPPLVFLLMYFVPFLLTHSSVSMTLAFHIPLMCAIIPLLLIKYAIWVNVVPATKAMWSGYRHVHIRLSNFGMANFVEAEWTRLNVSSVLLTFWLIRVCGHACLLTTEYLQSDVNSVSTELLSQMAKTLLVGGCDSLVAVLGMTSVVSYLCYYIGCLFQWVLLAEEDEEKPIGIISALLFYILAYLQSLTHCDPDQRLLRLTRNICLIFNSILHMVHNYDHPLLLSLSASHNPSLHRHLRALGVAFFIIVSSITLLNYLWSCHDLSTWLLAASIFYIEVILKVTVSLMIYCLFLLDAYRSTFWEKLDDYVYYIQAFGHVVEFSFGTVLFMNSAWILVFEEGSALRALMVGIHAYFNIWCDAQAGWRVFMKRRTAVKKINSLPEANSQQLRELNDVCSICYSEMQSAKITRCNHFFHGVCLRKWLYVQDRCPLCHDILYRVSSQEQLIQ